MASNKEIGALLRLVDDPDPEVYDTVAANLLGFGREIIPSLEQLWELTVNADIQQRIETLIHRVYFQDLQRDFVEWSRSPQPDLMRGAILIAKYHYPDLNEKEVYNHMDKVRRNVWLELNNYLSPIEQVHVLNSILYSYYKLQGHELSEREPGHFFINQVLGGRQGNGYSIGLIYLALCESLDIPMFPVDVPRQFLLAYIDSLQSFVSTESEPIQHILFYVDPVGGTIYTQKDVDGYLRKINAHEREFYFTPLPVRRVIYKMLEELSLCYRYKREDQKADEIMQLMQLVTMTKR